MARRYAASLPRTNTVCLLAVAACLFSFAASACAQDSPMQAGPITVVHSTALTNDSIIKMVNAGLGEDLILQSIKTQPGNYATSIDDMIALKKAGVSDRIVAAILTKATTPASDANSAKAAPPQQVLPLGVEDIGVYWKNRDGVWKRIAPEIVTYKSSNAIVPFATRGIVKADMNGHIQGSTANITLTNPLEILLYMPEGNDAEEYLLLKLRTSGKYREFRSATGGVFHSTTGADRDDVPFTPTRLGPRLYTFTLSNAKPGEYGILPPGAIRSINAASGGKIYTFHLLE